MDIDVTKSEIRFLRNQVELVEEWIKQTNQLIYEMQEQIFDWQDKQIENLQQKLTAK